MVEGTQLRGTSRELVEKLIKSMDTHTSLLQEVESVRNDWRWNNKVFRRVDIKLRDLMNEL